MSYYLAPGGGCEVLFSPGLSVCLSVCVSVCPANMLVFYFSAIRRDIDLKFIQDTYMVVLNSLRVKGQGHMEGILLFESTVISQKLSNRIFFFHRHLFGYSIR